MNQLPHHGRISCNKCFQNQAIEFDKTIRSDNGWRITANPLAWGNQESEIVVLGFSKGATQIGALANAPHDEIAYKGGRSSVGKILNHIGLLPSKSKNDLSNAVSEAIADKNGKFHFGSLIRCTVERHDEGEGCWKGSGGGMLDKFVATAFGQEIAKNCTEEFLQNLPHNTKLVVMFGLGSKLNYVHESFKLYQVARPGNWKWLNEIAYTDGEITIVHVEHFASQGALIPNWLGINEHPRSKFGKLAQEVVKTAINWAKPYEISSKTTSNIPLVTSNTVNLNVKEKVKMIKEKIQNISSDSSVEKEDTLNIFSIFQDANYEKGKNTKKFTEFNSANGKTIYLMKSSSMNNIILMAHPEINSEKLRRLNGVDSVSSEFKSHSNLNRFPKHMNSGKDPITYGWKIKVTLLSNISIFLNAFENMPA